MLILISLFCEFFCFVFMQLFSFIHSLIQVYNKLWMKNQHLSVFFPHCQFIHPLMNMNQYLKVLKGFRQKWPVLFFKHQNIISVSPLGTPVIILATGKCGCVKQISFTHSFSPIVWSCCKCLMYCMCHVGVVGHNIHPPLCAVTEETIQWQQWGEEWVAW